MFFLKSNKKLTDHFFLYEAACKDGSSYPRKWIKDRAIPLALDLETIREALGGKPLLINSWYRTPEYNKKVGGELLSFHTQGSAVDLWAKGFSSDSLFKIVLSLIEGKKIKDGGVGLYQWGVHYDHGPGGRRWDKR